ncbi:17996_t:CDS:2 [Funneliformis geosporum]|nr:17996_t:CDS:2 [Funneliformis geosporum]
MNILNIKQNETEVVNKTITSLKINDDLTFKEFGKILDQSDTITVEDNDQFRWSLDISSKINYHIENFIFVAVSHIDVANDMKKKDKTDMEYKKINVEMQMNKISYDTPKGNIITVPDKRTAIYYDKSEENDDYILKRLIVMNINGIYNFEYSVGSKCFNNNERFCYPKIFEEELKDWYADEGVPDCMDRLLSCIYDKYLLVEYYKNNIQFLEESNIKRSESMTKHIRKYGKYSYSIDNQKLQLCFVRGQSIIGLEISYKLFEEIRKIHLIEFIDGDEKLLLVCSDEEKNQKIIIWDLYNSDMIKTFPLCKNTHLARTSGNILQVDYKGNVTSILKMIDNELRKETENEKDDRIFVEYTAEIEKNPILKKEEFLQEKHTVFFYEDYDESKFKPLINEIEPWVMDNYDKTSFCLYNDEVEVLQLIIGRTTVQIWHKFLSNPKDKDKEKDKLPNEGKPFLELIWTNGIPIDQESKENRLRINKHLFGPKYFYLEIYWYENNSSEEVDEINVEENMKAMK